MITPDHGLSGDFGIARALSECTHLLHTLVGTPFYLAPELCEDKPYNSAADIWAVGICLVRPVASSVFCTRTQ